MPLMVTFFRLAGRLFINFDRSYSKDYPRGHDPKHVEQAGGFKHKLTMAKQIIGLVTLNIYLAGMFFLSKELQSQSINWTNVQYEVERTNKSVSIIHDDQIQAKVNKYCDKIAVPLELTLTMPIHLTRSISSNSAANSINNQISNLNSYMKNMIEEQFRNRFDSKYIQIMKAFNGLDASNHAT